MNDNKQDLVEDELGNVGIKLNDSLGAFLIQGHPIIADATSTKKKASLKSLPSPAQVEELRSMVPKKSLKEQFDIIFKEFEDKKDDFEEFKRVITEIQTTPPKNILTGEDADLTKPFFWEKFNEEENWFEEE